MTGWTALLLAGSRPGMDPFAAANGTDLKALIPVGGLPMVARPVAALLGSPEVDRVRVLAQEPDRIAAVLPNDKRLSVEPSGTTIAATLDAILGDPATVFPLLVTTADHALLTPTMIADFCGRAAGRDLALAVVERRSLLKRLPDSKRTWIGFGGGAYTGANLFAFGGPKARTAVALWRSVEQDRKKGWRVLGALGPAVVIGAALRLLTLDDVLTRIGKRLGLSIAKVEMADPIAAVDVDKQADLALANALIEGRA
jgi:GTP:adenosylcobinamide-phosphate guanylyltransferase